MGKHNRGDVQLKTTLLRLSTFILVAVISVGVTAQVESPDYDMGGGGGGSCVTCNTYQSGPVVLMSCRTPEGGWGHENCRIESYPEGTYCFVDGNQCCVD